MVERKVPDREGLELGIPCFDAAPVFVIELGEAGGHLAAAGSGRRDDDERAGGLDIVIPSVSVLTDDQRNINGIALDRIVPVYFEPQRLELFLVGNSGRLVGKARQHNAAHIETVVGKGVHQTQEILVVGDAQIASDFVLLDVGRVDGDHDLRLVLELAEHRDLGVRFEPRQHAGGVIVVKKFAAEFQVELAAELGDALSDVFRLGLEIFAVIKSDPHR